MAPVDGRALVAIAEAWCRGREAFTASNVAEEQARRRRHAGDLHVLAYKCPVCQRYHIGKVERLQLRAVLEQVVDMLRFCPFVERRYYREHGDWPPPADTSAAQRAEKTAGVFRPGPDRGGARPAEAGRRYLADPSATLTSLAAEFKVSKHVMREWLRGELVPIRRRRRRWVWRREDVDLAVEMASRGWPREQIAARFGVTWQTVGRALTAFGVDRAGLWPTRVQQRPVRVRPTAAPVRPAVPAASAPPVQSGGATGMQWCPPALTSRAKAVQRPVALRYLLDREITVSRLARVFKLTGREVTACLYAELVPLRGGEPRTAEPWSAEDVGLARSMAAAGWDDTRVAGRFEVSRADLCRGLQGAGVDLAELWTSTGRARVRR